MVGALKDGAKVSGLDISSNARDRFKNLGVMYDWNTLEGTYDLIIMHLVAQHMSDKSLSSSLEKLTRCLKTRGILKIQFAGLLNGKYGAVNHEESEVNLKGGGRVRSILEIINLHKEAGLIVKDMRVTSFHSNYNSVHFVVESSL